MSKEQAQADITSGPPPELRFRRPISVVASTKHAWRSRGFVAALVERNFRARYKKSILGPAWALIVPLGYVFVFSVVFNGVTKVATGGVPYPLFSYVALVPWGFFSSGLSSGSTSVVDNMTFVNKITAPREVYPLSALASGAVDTAIAASVLPFLFLITGRWPSSTIYWLPLLIFLEVVFTLGVVLIVSAVLPYLRDLRQVVGFVTQLMLFATPVAYSMKDVPEKWRLPLSIVNPLAPIIDGFRRCLLYSQAPQWEYLGPAALVSFGLLAVGYFVFKRLELGFADVA